MDTSTIAVGPDGIYSVTKSIAVALTAIATAVGTIVIYLIRRKK